MRYTRLLKLVTVFLLLLLVSGADRALAGISNAAVLFLRIAPGARPAGMGEAFVAIADDATATHWNPAGLGTYPLATTWIDINVPAQYRPVTAVAALKARSGGTHTAYDLWAASARGLVRYDSKNWHTHEVFSTKTDQTLVQIVGRYFGIQDESRLAEAVRKVAEANNLMHYDSVTAFRDRVLVAVPESSTDWAQLSSDLDSLVAAYDLCRINWPRFEDARDAFADGMKDGSLSQSEIDRLSFPLERSRTRFLPEEIKLPYSAVVPGNITAMASIGDQLVVGTDAGLVRFTGKIWQAYDVDEGLPSDSVTCLEPAGTNLVLVGTTRGLARLSGLTLEPYDSTAHPPSGNVEAIGQSSSANVFAVVDHDLYHFDGAVWSNSMPYTVAIEDTAERLASQMTIYRTADDRAAFVEKLEQNLKAATPLPHDGLGDSAASVPAPGLKPGTTVMIPYLGKLRSMVHSIYVGRGKTVWLGTETGIAYLENNTWVTPGYKDETLTEATTLETLVTNGARSLKIDPTAYRAQVEAFNDLPGDEIPAGTTVRLPRNAAASETRGFGLFDDIVYAASAGGLLANREGRWGRADQRGLGQVSTNDVYNYNNQTWFVRPDKAVVRSRGRTELSFMYVKWLPALADDLYYAYFSVTKATDKWGTFGGNITYISYGQFTRTGATGVNLGTFDSYDIAATLSYGTPLAAGMSAGVSLKGIYSKLSDQGAGVEVGKGTASGVALDLGYLWNITDRATLGAAVTNIGPKMTYIDAAQSDDLPRNLSVGLAYKVINGEYTRLVVTSEANKLLVDLTGKVGEQVKEVIINSGAELTYANLISARGGYVYDQEGKISVFTVGAGLNLADLFRFDFAYIPSQSDSPLNNILRLSMTVTP